MSTFVPAVNTAKVSLVGQSFGQTIVNTIWVNFATAITQSILDTLVNTVASWWDTNIKPNVSATTSLQTVTAVDQTTQSGPESSLSVGTSGTLASTSLANSNSLVCTLRTAKRGRSFRGRFYFGPLSQSLIDATDKNQVLAAVAVALAGQMAQLADDLAGMATPGTHVVASHFSNNAPRTTAEITPITAYHADTFIDSQRRRLTGRGA